MNKFLSHASASGGADTLDTYDAEIIEDIPEQFDLSRYKSKSKSIQEQYTPTNTKSSSNTVQHQSTSNLILNDPYQQQQQQTNDYYKQQQQQQPLTKSQLDSNSQAQFSSNQQQYTYPYTYQYNTTISQPTSQRYLTQDYNQQVNNNYDTSTTIKSKKSSKYPSQDYNTSSSRYTTSSSSSHPISSPNSAVIVSSTNSTTNNSTVPWTTRARSDERKKNSFGDDDDEEGEENNNEYNNNHNSEQKTHKKEYFLKGGDDVPVTKKWLINRENLNDGQHQHHHHNHHHSSSSTKKSMLKSDAYSRSDSGSIHFGSNLVGSSDHNNIPASSSSIIPAAAKNTIIKSAIKKHGVTFDEKLEVYEVKNPHYGLEVKSEKRELKKKKKDRQKEEEAWIKTKYDMKSRIQQQNMILYHFYEKTLIYNALVYYEEKYYRNSILRLQDKLKSSKTDEKLKEHFLQIIERENQTTVDIIKSIRRDYYSKLEPFCNQFQTTVEKLHTFPGMYQIIQQTAGSVQYSEIVSVYVNKEQNSSPSTLRKILGHDGNSRHLMSSGLHHHHHQTPIKPPPNSSQRKNNEPWIPKNVLAAIDMHVREISYSNYKTLGYI